MLHIKVTAAQVRSSEIIFRQEVAVLPTAYGYKGLPKLHEAMLRDNHENNNLFDQVKSFSSLTLENLITSPQEYEDRVNNIIYRWSGVDKQGVGIYGANIDARQMAIVEKFQGETLVHLVTGGYNPVLFWSSLKISKAYNEYFNHVFASLSVQLSGKYLFKRNIGGSLNSTYDLDIAILKKVGAMIAQKTVPADRRRVWKDILRIIEFSVGTKSLSPSDIASLDGIISQSDAKLSLQKILASIHTVDMRSVKNHDYATRVLGLTARDGDISLFPEIARKKDSSRQIIFSDIATDLIQACCKTKEDVFSHLKSKGFQSVEYVANPEVEMQFVAEIPYTSVIRASRMTVANPLADILVLLGGHIPSPDETLIFVFMRDDGVEWVYAHIQKW